MTDRRGRRARTAVPAVVRNARSAAPMGLCTDNGAMIAAIGDLLVRAGAEPAPLDVSIDPSAPLEYATLHPVARPLAGKAA